MQLHGVSLMVLTPSGPLHWWSCWRSSTLGWWTIKTSTEKATMQIELKRNNQPTAYLQYYTNLSYDQCCNQDLLLKNKTNTKIFPSRPIPRLKNQDSWAKTKTKCPQDRDLLTLTSPDQRHYFQSYRCLETKTLPLDDSTSYSIGLPMAKGNKIKKPLLTI
jgi:hypothetical protein